MVVVLVVLVVLVVGARVVVVVVVGATVGIAIVTVVDDVVDAFARAAEKGGGLLLNVGTGVETSVNDLYGTMARVAGVDRSATLAPARMGELERSALDASRAEIHLGWKPWTDLASGTAAVLEYFRNK